LSLSTLRLLGMTVVYGQMSGLVDSATHPARSRNNARNKRKTDEKTDRDFRPCRRTVESVSDRACAGRQTHRSSRALRTNGGRRLSQPNPTHLAREFREPNGVFRSKLSFFQWALWAAC